VLQKDMDRERSAEETTSAVGISAEEGEVFLAAAPSPPPVVFKSLRVTPASPITIQPILSPDNYMATIPGFIREAKTSILIEQQYIRAAQDQITLLCQAIADVRKNNPNVDIRILLAPPFADLASNAKPL